jgi:exodeoxyribonuclease VII small subunit
VTEQDRDPADLGYEEARDELVEIVRRLEAGAVSLEESLRLWERGETLAARCEGWLTGARARLDAAVTAGTATAPGTHPRPGPDGSAG